MSKDERDDHATLPLTHKAVVTDQHAPEVNRFVWCVSLGTVIKHPDSRAPPVNPIHSPVVKECTTGWLVGWLRNVPATC